MRIRIGDRVRIKSTGKWGTVVWRYNWSHDGRTLMCLVRLDAGFYVDRLKRQLEKLPQYRGYPQARDTETAMRHLQEYMK
jgi:hypothetical protein